MNSAIEDTSKQIEEASEELTTMAAAADGDDNTCSSADDDVSISSGGTPTTCSDESTVEYLNNLDSTDPQIVNHEDRQPEFINAKPTTFQPTTFRPTPFQPTTCQSGFSSENGLTVGQPVSIENTIVPKEVLFNQERIIYRPTKHIISVPREVDKIVYKPLVRSVEKVLHVPGPMVEVPTPQIMERRIQKPIFIDQELYVEASRKFNHKIVHGSFKDTECISYDPEIKIVDIYVPKIVPGNLSHSQSKSSHREMREISNAKFNSLLIKLNPNIPVGVDLPFRKDSNGEIMVNPNESLNILGPKKIADQQRTLCREAQPLLNHQQQMSTPTSQCLERPTNSFNSDAVMIGTDSLRSRAINDEHVHGHTDCVHESAVEERGTAVGYTSGRLRLFGRPGSCWFMARNSHYDGSGSDRTQMQQTSDLASLRRRKGVSTFNVLEVPSDRGADHLEVSGDKIVSYSDSKNPKLWSNNSLVGREILPRRPSDFSKTSGSLGRRSSLSIDTNGALLKVFSISGKNKSGNFCCSSF